VKILLWYWGRRGGGARYTLELARALAPQCDLSLSLSRGSELFTETAALGPGFPVDTYHDLPSAALASARIPMLRRQFARYLADAGVDVVISTMHHMWTALFVGAIKRAGPKLIVTVHDALPHPGDPAIGWDWMLRRQIDAADGLMVLSTHVRDQLAARYGTLRKPVSVVRHPAFNFSNVPVAPRRFPTGRPFRLLFFGRIRPYKGLGQLLDAAALLERNHNFTLCLAGQGDLTPHAAQIAALKSVNVINRWIEEGEVADLFAENDLLVATYVEASQSGVVPSAYSAGLPVIANPTGGLAEQIQDGVTGLLTDEASAAAIAKAIARLIEEPALYEACSVGALRASHERFGWGAIASGYLTLARELSSAS
jgi:glycosyltransferase involved in cell wall biosynthesis